MARRRKIRKAHPRLFKFLTIFGATVGIISGSAFSVMMAIDAAKGDLISEELREYTASFSTEGSLITKNTYKRGDPIEMPENPAHAIDGENNYFFIGWDTNHNGIPDYVPKRAYYSFDAEAVYFKTGKFDLNFLDLLNMDLEDLLALLEKLNIDWETFMKMFNITPEMLMELLKGQIAFTYETNPASSEYPAYFRTTSYGDFDYSKKTFKAPDYYDSSLISDNSVNPLSFLAYKLKKLEETGTLPNGFGFVDYDITYNAKEEYYPTPECQISEEANEYINSDAHYLVEPDDSHYRASAVYCPAFTYIINMMSGINLPTTVSRDEKKYYQYALDHYTSIPREYESVIDEMIIENDWYEEELFQVDAIASYVSNLGAYNLFNDDGSVDVNSYLNSKSANKDPVMGLIETQKGSDLDFNTTAVMLFRRLHIPARLVKGYLAAGSNGGVNEVYLMQQHYWCEIYVKGTGWMICECTNLSNILGTDPYGVANQNNTSLENKHILDRITINRPSNTEYEVGDYFNRADGSITAYFQDGTTAELNFTSPGVTLTGLRSDYLLDEINDYQKITVTYTYEGVSKSASFYISVSSNEDKIVRISFDFSGFETEYYQGQNVDKSGIAATAFYSKKDPEPVPTDLIEVLSYNKNVLGSQTIRVRVSTGTSHITDESKKSASYDVYVYKKKVVSLDLDIANVKTDFFAGDTFNYENLKVTANYYDGTFDLITDYFVNEPSSAQMSAAGTYDVMVGYYNDKPSDPTVYNSYQINVATNNLVSITVTDYKNSYQVGEVFTQSSFLSGATVQVTYQETGTKTVTSGITVSTPDLSSTGSKPVTVTYTSEDFKTISTTVDINVIAGTVVFNLSYICDTFYEETYNGVSHRPSDGAIICTPSGDFPSFLKPQFVFVPVYDDDDGSSADIFQYVPQLVGIFGANDIDVQTQYDWSIGTGSDGVLYVVNPCPVTITISPSKATVKPYETFDVIVSGSLVGGDQLVVSGNEDIYYTVSNDYDNYPITILFISHKDGSDASGCYDPDYVRTKVKVRD